MKLEALREIAGNRTPGKWDYDWGNWDIENSDRETLCCFNSDCREAGLEKQGHDDGEFVATAANTYDLLLDIAEAADKMKKYHFHCTWPDGCICGGSELLDAFSKLENS